MQSKKIILLFVAISCLYSCIDKHHPELENLIIPPTTIDFINKYTLEQTQNLPTIHLPDGIPNYIGMVDNLVHDSIYFFKYAENKIAEINLYTSTIDSIILPKEIITGKIKSINILSKDSILLVQDNPQSLILIKKGVKGNITLLPMINFKHENHNFEQLNRTLTKNEGNYIIDYSHVHYNDLTHKVHIGVQPYMAHNNEGFEESQRIAVYNLSTKSWEDQYAAPLGILKYKKDKTFTYLLSQKRIFSKNDTVFINYFNDHYIYYYKNGKYLGKFAHVSKHSKEMSHPVSTTYLENAENRKKYTYSASKYGNFFYHKKANLYSRLYFDQQDPFDKHGKYKHPELSRNVYVVFLDQNFKYVGEYQFQAESISFNSCKPTSDGFMLFDMSQKSNLEKEFALKYNYKITKTIET